MKILSVSDKVVNHIYGPTIKTLFGDVGLVLGCGDLPYYYLEFIVSSLHAPLVYVHGNHDPPMEHTSYGRSRSEPEGCVNADERVLRVDGLLVAGLEGSIRYRPTGDYQYTEFDMWLKVLRLTPSLFVNRLKYGRYLDVLIAHSPPYGIHNGPTRAHVGFKSFLWLMRHFKPSYMVHGHKHVYNCMEVTVTKYEQTTVMNTFPYKVWNIET